MNAPLLPFASRPVAQRIKVYLMHSSPIVRAGLGAMLAGEPDLEVSAPVQWPCADEACVVIADYFSALRAARDCGQAPAQSARAMRLLVVSSQGKAGEVRHAVDSGVHGYLLQEADAGELLECVRLLGIGVGTVKTHMKQLMHKFDVSTRTQVVLSAMEQGLLGVPFSPPA
ncbi:response regulator transcription factor [Pseudoduganella aquatica]|uniref:response regulator transcription factor n=1 Tax=Pseudoduganella aquatica TaxID=2660641 RepID=UPI001E284A33|nr:hypothetical protein [Pseudoduganella aquatica]